MDVGSLREELKGEPEFDERSLPLEEIFCTGVGDVRFEKPISGVALLDCGANIVCISPRVFKFLQQTHQVSSHKEGFSIKLGDGLEGPRVEYPFCEVLFRLVLNSVPLSFKAVAAVKETGRDVIISHHCMKANGIHLFLHDPELFRRQYDPPCREELEEPDFSVFDVKKEVTGEVIVDRECPDREMVQTVVDNYQDLFAPMTAKDFINVAPFEVELIPGAELKSCPVRRLSPTYRVQVREQLDELLELDIIEPVDTAIASPIVVIPKPDGDIRMCVDYSIFVNPNTVKLRYPMPDAKVAISCLAKHRLYAVIDLVRGFHQMRMASNSVSLTAFICCFGTSAFKRVPFGLCNAPALFQRAMVGVLGSLISRPV